MHIHTHALPLSPCLYLSLSLSLSLFLMISKVDLPDYARAWFYPLRPWGAPVSMFPQIRLRGQSIMLLWEIFTVGMIA